MSSMDEACSNGNVSTFSVKNELTITCMTASVKTENVKTSCVIRISGRMGIAPTQKYNLNNYIIEIKSLQWFPVEFSYLCPPCLPNQSDWKFQI